MLETVSIQNYRNLKDLNIPISEKINLIIASNGSGKTNFLEVVYYSIFGESFRPLENNFELLGLKDSPLKISLKFDLEKLDVVINNNQRKFILNNKKVFLSKLPQRFPVILFAPQSVDLVSREPGLRRQDMDHFLSIIDKNYKDLISRYKQILKNRNSLIKMIRENRARREDLQFWTDKMIDTSDQIFQIRIKFFEEIKLEMRKTIDLLGADLGDDSFNSLDINYISSLGEVNIENFSTRLADKFGENIDKEIVVGKTLYGIHKDDFQVTLRESNLRYFGSRGQQRIGILLFKLAEAFYIKKLFEKMPLILLDDLMSELDNDNREKIATILLKLDAQIVMTTADENEIPVKLKNAAQLISIF